SLFSAAAAYLCRRRCLRAPRSPRRHPAPSSSYNLFIAHLSCILGPHLSASLHCHQGQALLLHAVPVGSRRSASARDGVQGDQEEIRAALDSMGFLASIVTTREDVAAFAGDP
ncbi:unnamed protein product, partial [Urochloa humidicola]